MMEGMIDHAFQTHVHGTAVYVTPRGAFAGSGGCGVLLRGASGAGKSDLALRLIHDGADLLADDQVVLSVDGAQLVARPDDRLAGLLEIRGLGVVRLPHVPAANIALVVDLVPRAEVARLPASETTVLLDIAVPLVRLDAWDLSAVAKIHAALAVVADPQKVIR